MLFLFIIYMSKDFKMTFSEHIEELRQRLFFTLIILVVFALLSIFKISDIIKFLQLPAQGIRFLQLAPGEYFFVSFKVAFILSILCTLPFFLYQMTMFILPGLTRKEQKIFTFIIFIGYLLFILGLIFCYFILIPRALKFFINYGAEIIEPFWSFKQYFDFILVLLISTGVTFELPIVQLLLSFFNLVSYEQMWKAWRYILFVSTVIGAVLTPSTDPFTQLLFALTFLILYMFGILLIFLVKDKFSKNFL
uniref:Sec-independent translocase component C n=1 Tax=Glaucosphaera vacuolata TaxID=38265 RepID=UPI001FCDB6FB|nr:Sec-independent translocase component C [Glaucosphaera vacuolata]UNJ18648.1 Sec-independent translocase component C [Glaucosphaera vacuolata]